MLRQYTDVQRSNDGRTFSVEEQRRLMDYVDARLDESISVERLASLVRLGAHRCTRTFRATFGQTAHAWLRGRRLKRAHELLVTTSHSISSIAMATGFADQSHFTRFFSAEFGIKPAPYVANGDTPRRVVERP